MTDTLTVQSITIADKAAVEELYSAYGRCDSAHAFASLFLWKQDMDLSLYMTPDVYTVRSGWKGENSWFYPCGKPEARLECVETLVRSGCRRLCYLQKEDAEELNRYFPGVFTIHESPEDSEYLYNREEILQMAGGRFVKMRNLYRRLQKEHEITTAPITEDILPAVRDICRQWQQNRGKNVSLLWEEPTNALLDNWNALEARGVILRLDGKDWAVSAGFPLSEGVYDCCLHNARENLPGMTENLRAAFVGACPEHVGQFNYEEDLGTEGLRLTKERLRPCAMIQMFTGERSL